MNNIEVIFRKPNINDIEELENFKKECIEYNSTMDGTGVLSKYDAKAYLIDNKKMETIEDEHISKSLRYGLFIKETDELVGLISVRLELKGYLIKFGGHIGYCVKPSKRRLGFAKKMLKYALCICKENNIDEVLITCLEDNIASSKTIESCGGCFESLIFDNVNYQQNMKRYWIKLNKE